MNPSCPLTTQIVSSSVYVIRMDSLNPSSQQIPLTSRPQQCYGIEFHYHSQRAGPGAKLGKHPMLGI